MHHFPLGLQETSCARTVSDMPCQSRPDLLDTRKVTIKCMYFQLSTQQPMIPGMWVAKRSASCMYGPIPPSLPLGAAVRCMA